jgi:uncharacterized SAM-binding protein YcdF (DUF218 family)
MGLVKSKLKRRAWWAAGIALLLAVGTAALLLVGAKAVLLVEGGNRSAEVIVILGGDAGDRVFRALELHKAGAAPRFLISGAGDCFLIRDRLVLAGVNTNAIAMEPNSRNTRENAEFSIRLLKDQGVRSAIVITSWYHSRRALACFRKLGADLEISSFPAYHGISMDQKPQLTEIPNVGREYVAMAWYLVRYGITPFPSIPAPGKRRGSTSPRHGGLR